MKENRNKLEDFITHLVKFYGVDEFGHLGISAFDLYEEILYYEK